MPNQPNVAAAAAYGTKFAKGIIAKVFSDLMESGIQVYPGIKGPTKFGKLSAGKGLKAYDGNFTGDGSVVFTDRELNPKLAAYEMIIEPAKYYQTWMADQFDASATSKKIPFENYVWEQIKKEVADEIINSVLHLGDTAYVGSDNARKICDGFKKIIPTLGLTPVTTGVIALSTAIDQFEAVADSVPVKFRKQKMFMYCSHNAASLYNKRYRALYNGSTLYNEFGRVAMDVNRNIEIMPVEWLGNSNLLICTPKQNLVMGTDLESDMNTIKTVDKMWTIEAGIRFSIGLQIPDAEAIFINDQIAA
jgi:hypothetical protein